MANPLPKHRAREYETIFIIHPEAVTETIEQVAGKLTDVIDRLSGKLIRVENWGRRRLAYPIRRQQKGIYIYLRYLGYSDIVEEMERVMRMVEPVLKYLTVKLDEDVNPDARPVRDEDISFLPHFDEETEAASKEGTPAVKEKESQPTQAQASAEAVDEGADAKAPDTAVDAGAADGQSAAPENDEAGKDKQATTSGEAGEGAAESEERDADETAKAPAESTDKDGE